MKGDAAILKQLNIVLKNELVSINQTFLHSRMLNDWGLDDLGEKEYKKSIADMKQADQLIERTLFLEGFPNLQDLGRLRIGENAEEILTCEYELVNECVTALRDAIMLCEEKEDFVSRDLFEDLLEDEEAFLDWVETQKGLIDKMGLQNYIQSQA
jgi:bacterioferritin